jgi:hypothetical protein
MVNGTIHAGDPVAAQAQIDLTTAFNDAAGRSTAPVIVAGNLGGMTLAPGLYKSATSLEISSGDLTLDAQGDPNAVFIFQMGSTFVTTSGRQVILIGGAQAANIFWQVGSSATIGTTSVVEGNILADQSISLTTGATLDGRALARIAAVTMDANSIINGIGSGNNSNQPPVCALQIACAFTPANGSNAFVISLNDSSACVILDASGSSDSAHNPLQISWLVDGTNLESGAVITNCLPVGCHSVLLTVSDGRGGLTSCETNLCVITAEDAVDHLIVLVEHTDFSRHHRGHGNKWHAEKQSLLATLQAADASFDRGSFESGMNQLEAFQHKVHAQLGRTDPHIAALFIGRAQQILDAIDCAASHAIGGIGGDDDDHHEGGDDGHHGEGEGRDR